MQESVKADQVSDSVVRDLQAALPKHTPGPWDIELAEVYAIRDAEGGRIALMTNLRGRHGMGGRRDGDEVAANTRLVAAAPELLEALQLLHDDIAEYARINNLGGYDNHCMRLARAALAKATGAAA